MKTSNLMTRFLEGITSADEERQLRKNLEARAVLSDDERAVLDLLRVSFPEEDATALLTEDLSAEYDALLSVRVNNTIVPLLYWRHWVWVSGIAASILIVFLLCPESHEAPINTVQQSVSVMAKATPSRLQPKDTVVNVIPPRQSLHSVENGNNHSGSGTIVTTQVSSASMSYEVSHVQQSEHRPSSGFLCNGESVAEEVKSELAPDVRLCIAEIENEWQTHQLQSAYEQEMRQRSIDQLIYIMEQIVEDLPVGGVIIQNS